MFGRWVDDVVGEAVECVLYYFEVGVEVELVGGLFVDDCWLVEWVGGEGELEVGFEPFYYYGGGGEDVFGGVMYEVCFFVGGLFGYVWDCVRGGVDFDGVYYEIGD